MDVFGLADRATFSAEYLIANVATTHSRNWQVPKNQGQL